jgi:hypothetical protein
MGQNTIIPDAGRHLPMSARIRNVGIPLRIRADMADVVLFRQEITLSPAFL